MTSRPRSESRQRTKSVLVRLTPAEFALVQAVQRQTRARGAGTVLRDAFTEKWRVIVVVDEMTDALSAVRARGEPAGLPDTASPPPAAQRPAQACAGAPEPMSGRMAGA